MAGCGGRRLTNGGDNDLAVRIHIEIRRFFVCERVTGTHIHSREESLKCVWRPRNWTPKSIRSHKMKTLNPTGSYCISLPDDVAEDYDERVASYWKEGHSLLLQVSSYIRHEGPQVSAAERLDARLQQESLSGVSRDVCITIDCPDIETAGGIDCEGTRWVYVYAVWPDLTIFASISGDDKDVRDNSCWALEAINSILRRGDADKESQ